MNAHVSDNTAPCCRPADNGKDADKQYIDPVCGMALAGDDETLSVDHGSRLYHFCSTHCLRVFEKEKHRMTPGEALLPRKNRALLIGAVGFTVLLLVFLTVLVLANQTVAGALSEVSRLWYWVLILASGFGLQLGLFVHIRHAIREQRAGATAEVAASGAISTGSMIACCSHGLVNLLPVFGISAAAAFLARYQMPFILFGVFSNLVGVTIMLGLARKSAIVFSNPLLQWLAGWNMKLVRILLIVIGTMAISISIAVI